MPAGHAGGIKGYRLNRRRDEAAEDTSSPGQALCVTFVHLLSEIRQQVKD